MVLRQGEPLFRIKVVVEGPVENPFSATAESVISNAEAEEYPFAVLEIPRLVTSQGLEYMLSCSNPNTASGEGQILFQLPEQATVSLVLYDMLGNKVYTLRDSERLPAGFYSCRISNKTYRAGIYVVRMEARAESSSFIQSKRFIVK